MTTILLSSIRTDGETQLRAACSEATVSEYAEALKSGASFPPVIVFQDGEYIWLADGFHRFNAHVLAGLTEISADVREGTRRDAVLFAAGANAEHGLRRTSEDKRHAVEMLLRDFEWSNWADRDIAKRAKVSHPFVAKVRRELNGNVSIEPTTERKFISKHGTEATRSVPSQQKTGSVFDTVICRIPDMALADIIMDRPVVLAEIVRRLQSVEASHV